MQRAIYTAVDGSRVAVSVEISEPVDAGLIRDNPREDGGGI